MRFTPEESKVIGYMYKFKLSMSPILHQIMYETGIGGESKSWFWLCRDSSSRYDS